MKKLFLILFLMPLAVGAQKIETRIDRITGDTLVLSKPEKLFGKPSFTGTVGEQLFFILSKSKSANSISFFVQTGKSLLFTIKKDDKAHIKFTDGSVLTLSPIANNVSEANHSVTGSTASGTYILSNADIELIKTKKVQFIRIESSRQNFEYEIKDKNALDIKKVADVLF